jgi:mRNA-degrading endonuclease toxin of MazEF toxin-antitoxin module
VAGCANIHGSSCRQLPTPGRNRRREHRVFAEQTAAVDSGQLGKSLGFLSVDEMRRVDATLRIVLDL